MVEYVTYDDTLLDTVSVKQGETAVYTKDKPTKPATIDYYYSFKGWDKDLIKIFLMSSLMFLLGISLGNILVMRHQM